MFTISIINMSIFGLIHIKDVNLLEEIAKIDPDSWLFSNDIVDKVKFKFTINDRFDVCVKIFCQADDDEFAIDQSWESYYVYEPAYKNLNKAKLKKLNSKIREMLDEDIKSHDNKEQKQRILKVP